MGFSAVGLASAVGGVASSVIGSKASKKAASAQQQAAQTASGTQMDMFNRVRSDLAPYMAAGQIGSNRLLELIASPDFNKGYAQYTPYADFVPVTAENLEATPGYQFTRDQGMRATMNSASASGLTGSGAQARGIADYVTGLAQNTYNQQVQNRIAEYNAGLSGHVQNYMTGFNAYQSGIQNAYNRLLGVAQLGQNSAAQQANLGTQTAQTIGGNQMAAGNAAASGYIGAANALSGGLNTALGGLSNAYLMNSLMSQYGNPNQGLPQQNLWTAAASS